MKSLDHYIRTRGDEAAPFVVIGCDPGPELSAFATVACRNTDRDGLFAVLGPCGYLKNDGGEVEEFRDRLTQPGRFAFANPADLFLCYESCGARFGASVGQQVYETAAMGGEIRTIFRPLTGPAYHFKPVEWRYLLTGYGNAKTPEIYGACCEWFDRSGGGADPYRGTKAAPGPLAGLYDAGKGGNMAHMKDALGVALAALRCHVRIGASVDRYRRGY